MKIGFGAFACLLVLASFANARAETKWLDYRDPKRGFSIQFPGAPQLKTHPLAGFDGVTDYEYRLSAANYVYSVSVMQFGAGQGPRAPVVPLLDVLLNNYAKDSGSTLRDRKSTMLSGQAGLEAVTEDAAHDRYHLVDLFAAGDRVYLVVAVGPKGFEAGDDAGHFRDSLKLIPR
jgi:hypothetical protein